jgi:hypothetical protein
LLVADASPLICGSVGMRRAAVHVFSGEQAMMMKRDAS